MISTYYLGHGDTKNVILLPATVGKNVLILARLPLIWPKRCKRPSFCVERSGFGHEQLDDRAF